MENGVLTIFPEKRPALRFCLNITRPIHIDFPHRFAKLLEAKRKRLGYRHSTRLQRKYPQLEKYVRIETSMIRFQKCESLSVFPACCFAHMHDNMTTSVMRIGSAPSGNIEV